MSGRLRRLADEVRALEARLRLGGGPDKIEKQHKQGKLTARERVAHLADPGTPFLEIGLLVAYDRYEGQAPGAGVITGILLALARIAGETAPLLFTALSNQFWSTDLSQPMANLPVTIFKFALSPFENWQKMAWAGVFLITMGVLALNIIARVMFRKKD
jgi:hypothetical protein